MSTCAHFDSNESLQITELSYDQSSAHESPELVAENGTDRRTENGMDRRTEIGMDRLTIADGDGEDESEDEGELEMSEGSPAEKALEGRIRNLQADLDNRGGRTWLNARGNFEKSKGEVQSLQAQHERDAAKLAELNDLLGVGAGLRQKGKDLLSEVGSVAGASSLQSELLADAPERATDVNLTDRRVDQLGQATSLGLGIRP